MTPAACAPRELAQAEVIPVALAAGALGAADVVDDGVQVDAVGRSHAVFRVSVAGEPRFFLKAFGARRGATDGLVARELALQRLATERPAVAAVVAPPWPWDVAAAARHLGRDTDVVASAALPGATAWALDRSGGGGDDEHSAFDRLASLLAGPLAAFHRATRDLARPAAQAPAVWAAEQPWGLALMDGDAPPELWAHAGVGPLLHEAASDQILVAGLRAARALWHPMVLMHGDLKHDNVLVDTRAWPPRVWLLDWEMSRIGDPAWDLACLAVRLPVVHQAGPPWAPADLDSVARWLHAYAAAAGLPAPALARRVLPYAGAVLLMMSLQQASMRAPGADLAEARLLLDKARSTFHRLPALLDTLLARWPSAGEAAAR
jgi:Ser/Thr protein kinase RdoA (MazF antagonist)